MTDNTGGYAFPRSETLYPDGSTSDPGAVGMTLRDYFAAKAMQALIARNVPNISVIARESYRYADAMLKEREAK